MRRFLVWGVFLGFALVLMGGVAWADDDDGNDNCKQIKVKVGTAFYPDPAACPESDWPTGDMAGCIETAVRGILKGTWLYYFPVDGNFFLELDPSAGHPGFAAFVAFSVFKTEKGELWTRDATILDVDHLDGFQFFTQASVIVGGTEKYDGATGELGYVGDEFSGIIRGEVCTP